MEEAAASGGVTVRNRQDRRAIEDGLLARLAACGSKALDLIRERYLQRVNPPEAVAVELLDDAEIGRIHGEFLGDPNPTDVITFPYGLQGEILISVETAERQAREYQVTFARELALYLIHGVLHLCGYEDRTDSSRREMERIQESLLAETFADG